MLSPPIKCQLALVSENNLVNSVEVEYTVENITNQDVTLLTWYTPLEGFLSDLFLISNNQTKRLDYKGKLVKRLQPEPEDYLVLPAKKRFSIRLDLAEAYSFSLGHHQIQLKKTSFKLSLEQQPTNFECQYLPLEVIINKHIQ